MKKIIVLVVVLFSTYTFSQKASSEYRFFSGSRQAEDSEPEEVPSEPGDPAPIDDYIPVLVAAGLGLAVYYGRSKFAVQK